jgi:hypothetical protein
LVKISDTHQWRPSLLFAREDLFVFEDVNELGYKMPDTRSTLTLDELKACVITLANFHAQSYIFEENRSKELNRSYRIWEEYGDYLTEPKRTLLWRNAGRTAIIEAMKVYSKEKSNPKFISSVDSVVTALFDKAHSLMAPSSVYRNVVVHRDLWTNNILLKEINDGTIHALFVDFQTVLYSPPMLDLSSLMYFNTIRSVRDIHIDEILNLYYDTLSKILKLSNMNIDTIMDRKSMSECYEESIAFGLTQAALIIPITTIDVTTKEQVFCDPETSSRINEVSRSAEFIEIAKNDDLYRDRLVDIIEEIVDRYVCPITL